MPQRATTPGGVVSALPGLDALLQRRSLARLHAEAIARLHACSPDVAPLACPLTLALPEEHAQRALHAAYAPDARWLRRPRLHDTNLRPDLLGTTADTSGDSRWDAQWLVASPQLVDGHKFTLRVAAVIDSITPLRAALWREPRVLRAPARYDERASGSAFLDAYVTSEVAADVDWRAALTAGGLSPDAVLRSAEHTIAALLASVSNEMREAEDALRATPGRGFCVLEFDVLVDRAGQAHLLECARWPHVKPGRLSGAALLDDWSVALMRAVLARLDDADDAQGFTPLFPSPSLERLALITEPHQADVAAALDARDGSDAVFVPQHVAHHFLDDAVVIFAEVTGGVSVLNPSASYAWMRLAEGGSLDTTIDETAGLFQAPRDVVAMDVWTAVASWIRAGLVGRRAPAPLPLPDAPTARVWGWNAGERIYQHLGWPVLVRCPGDAEDGWLSSTLLPYASDAREARSTIEVLQDGDAYALLVDGSRRVGPLTPRDTPAAVHMWLRRLALEGRQGVLGLTMRLVHAADDPSRALLLVGSGGPDAEGPGVATRIHITGRPLTLRRETAPDAVVSLVALVRIEWAPGPPALAPMRRAEALQSLLEDDARATTAFDAESAGALVAFMRERPCYVLTAATPDDASVALAAMLTSL